MLRSPEVVMVTHRVITMMRRGRQRRVKRWYVTLKFGAQTKRLAVDEAAVAWMQGCNCPPGGA